MPKYRVKYGVAATSGPEDRGGAGTSDPEDSSGVGTSGPEDRGGAGTSDPEDSSGVSTSGPEDSSNAGTSGPEDRDGTGTSDPEDSSGAGTSDLQDRDGAGTSDTEDNSVAGTSVLEDRDGAGTIDSDDNSIAGTSDHEDSCSAGTYDHEDNSVAGPIGPQDCYGADASGPEGSRCTGTSSPEDKSGAGTSGLQDKSVAGTSSHVNSYGAATSGSVTDPMSPMSDTENWFIEKRIDDIAKKYHYDVSKRGKWIMHCTFDQMNEMWAKVCRLYTEGQLTGIQFVRTSTGKNKEAQPCGGAIRFYCGPSDDDELVKSYGRNAVCLMNYCSKKNGYIAFKSDEQTQGKNKGFFIHRLKVPRTTRGSGSHDECDDDVQDEILKPMSIMDRKFISETNVEIHDRYERDLTQHGCWTMSCHSDNVDDAWRETCTLYRQGKLTGVKFIGVITALSPQRPKRIYFFCGPCSNRDLMMKYGRGIARQLGHHSTRTPMGYKVIDTETRISLTKQLMKTEEYRRFIYRLSI